MQKARLLDGILAFCIFYNYGERFVTAMAIAT